MPLVSVDSSLRPERMMFGPKCFSMFCVTFLNYVWASPWRGKLGSLEQITGSAAVLKTLLSFHNVQQNNA